LPNKVSPARGNTSMNVVRSVFRLPTTAMRGGLGMEILTINVSSV
jgi:hypothetical protein